MGTSRDPARSRPLSANVKRLMRLSRAAPKNGKVIKTLKTKPGEKVQVKT